VDLADDRGEMVLAVGLERDVLQQQSAVASANNEYEQALLSFWTAKANFEKALGEE
jgi:outer membrane protein TolC